jgi:hypothetical protein
MLDMCTVNCSVTMAEESRYQDWERGEGAEGMQKRNTGGCVSAAI